MTPAQAILATLVAAGLLGGGAVGVKVVTGRLILARLEQYLPIFRKYAQLHNVPVSWIVAIARQETAIDPTLVNMTGGDAVLGGSFSMFQLTASLAKSLGFTGRLPEASGGKVVGSIAGTLADPEISTNIVARYLSDLRAKGYDMANAASTYNNGRTLQKLKDDLVLFRSRASGARTGVAKVDALSPESARRRVASLEKSRDEYVPRVVSFEREFQKLNGPVKAGLLVS